MSSAFYVCCIYSSSRQILSLICLFVWFDSLRPSQQSFSYIRTSFLGWTSTKQGLMCLVQGHKAVTLVRLEPKALRSRVKHSTTEPLRSQFYHGSNHYEPCSDCALGSSLIWAHIVCNIGYLRALADEWSRQQSWLAGKGINVHAQLPSWAGRLVFHLVLNLHLHSNFVLSSKGSDETVRMRRFNISCAQKRLMDYPIHIDTILKYRIVHFVF